MQKDFLVDKNTILCYNIYVAVKGNDKVLNKNEKNWRKNYDKKRN